MSTLHIYQCHGNMRFFLLQILLISIIYGYGQDSKDSFEDGTLTFQNYVDDDSVKGVVSLRGRWLSSFFIKCRPHYLTSYQDEAYTFYLYGADLDSVYHFSSRFDYVSHEKLYFYTDSLIGPKLKSIGFEADEVYPAWFYRGRAFVKPDRLRFYHVTDYKYVPNGFVFRYFNPRLSRGGMDKPPYQSVPVAEQGVHGVFPNPILVPYRIKFGLPYPFLRPHFQVAFEKYVLSDWEEYLKNQKAEKEK
ncbi:hypothetical protein [Owenweeksia hongkongensis]|uniref:hypothetical protein n=1 Tax=Owenweeksia hongkongensis TaxID=253245 RepID=UPI003A91E1E1